MGFKFADVDIEYEKLDLLKKDDVDRLKQWYNKQRHLPKIHELKLIFFLQSCDYNVEQTKVYIENYFEIRARCPEIFTNRGYDVIKHCLDHVLITTLPKRTKDDCTVSLFKLLDTNLDKFEFVNWIKMGDMILTLNFMLNGTQNEQILILDMEGTHLGHLLRLNLAVVQKYGAYIQEGVRAKIRAIHIINTSSLTEKLIIMVKPLITSGLLEVIEVHSKIDSLYEYVPKEVLPREYGGDEVSINELKENVGKILRENDDYFELEAKEIVDESKRMKLTQNSLFGFDGSFKKLNID